MIDINGEDYKISVQKIVQYDKNVFEASVQEIPNLYDYGDTFEEAHNLMVESIEMSAEIWEEGDAPFPKPAKRVDDYSGRFTVRGSKSIHKEIAEVSDRDGISISKWMELAAAEKLATKESCAKPVYSDLVIASEESPSGEWETPEDIPSPILTVVRAN